MSSLTDVSEVLLLELRLKFPRLLKHFVDIEDILPLIENSAFRGLLFTSFLAVAFLRKELKQSGTDGDDYSGEEN